MMSTWKGCGGEGGPGRGGSLEVRHLFVDSNVLKQNICCSFLWMREWVGVTVGHYFCGRHKCMTPNTTRIFL